jgi:3',5'-cyclic AMP phosphodiesterase CpdA
MALHDRRTVLKTAAAWALAPLVGRADDPVPALAPDFTIDPYADAIRIDHEPPKLRPGAFTIAVLPDTQHYSERFPDTYMAQTRWLLERQRERNIVAVLHLGDITNRSTPAEWKNAQRAMRQLDGSLPYAFSTGNHDYSEGGVCKDRSTRLNEYFPVAHYRSRPGFGGVYDKEPDRMENNYQTFSAGGRDFLVLALEFGPRADVVRWANEVVTRHASREVILITHALIYHDNTRFNWKKYGNKQSWNPHAYAVAKATNDDVSDGEELWTNLIARHENFIFTLNGHVLGDGLARYTSTTPAGRAVPQVLVNYQMRPNGGDGWLRLLEFAGDGRSIEVHDYSPTLRQSNVSPENWFTMKTAPVKNA